MPIYLVEIRTRLAEHRIKEINNNFSRTFGVPTVDIPHITLFGPFILKKGVKETDLLTQIARQIRKFDSIPVLIDGFDKREGMKGYVVAHKVNPGDELVQIKRSFIAELNKITRTRGMGDRDLADTWFHITIAKRLTGQRSEQIWDTLVSGGSGDDSTQEQNSSFPETLLIKLRELFLPGRHPARVNPLTMSEEILRVGILRNSQLFAEFDLTEKRWLSRP